MANAALGACDRGKDGDSAWRIYSFMLAQDLVMDSITFKALISALAKVDHWRQCCAVFVRALNSAVALEAVSVMVLLFALVRVGRWDVAESVFLCAYEASCDTSALLAVQPPLLQPSAPASGDSGDDADAPALAGDISRSSASTRAHLHLPFVRLPQRAQHMHSTTGSVWRVQGGRSRARRAIARL